MGNPCRPGLLRGKTNDGAVYCMVECNLVLNPQIVFHVLCIINQKESGFDNTIHDVRYAIFRLATL